MYTITRQIQWPDGNKVVEISKGGLDYTNPDALVPAYDGEFEEFSNPIEAVETAIEICRQWRKNGGKGAMLGIGATLGMTLPFDTCSFKDAIAWAKEKIETLKTCPHCNEIMEGSSEFWHAGEFTENDFYPYDDGPEYCSKSCAEANSLYQ